jgi:hypothetical protein
MHGRVQDPVFGHQCNLIVCARSVVSPPAQVQTDGSCMHTTHQTVNIHYSYVPSLHACLRIRIDYYQPMHLMSLCFFHARAPLGLFHLRSATQDAGQVCRSSIAFQLSTAAIHVVIFNYMHAIPYKPKHRNMKPSGSYTLTRVKSDRPHGVA